MTKTQAVLAIIRDAKRQGMSLASYKRVTEAIYELGLIGSDMDQVLAALEYHDAPGMPCAWLKRKVFSSDSNAKE